MNRIPAAGTLPADQADRCDPYQLRIQRGKRLYRHTYPSRPLGLSHHRPGLPHFHLPAQAIQLSLAA